jgi:hypothetical protein
MVYPFQIASAAEFALNCGDLLFFFGVCCLALIGDISRCCVPRFLIAGSSLLFPAIAIILATDCCRSVASIIAKGIANTGFVALIITGRTGLLLGVLHLLTLRTGAGLRRDRRRGAVIAVIRQGRTCCEEQTDK